MTGSPPPSPLIASDTRRRLQLHYEEAVRLIAQRPCDHARVHELLAKCLRADPGNTLYLDELLANLRHWNPQAARSWLPAWLWGAGQAHAPAKDYASPDELLRAAPELLRTDYTDARLLGRLATVAGKCHLGEAELSYWWHASN